MSREDEQRFRLVGLHVQRAREKLGISLEDFSEKVHIASAKLRKFEAGERPPFGATEVKLETAFGWRFGSIQSMATGKTTEPEFEDFLEYVIRKDPNLSEDSYKTLIDTLRQLRRKDAAATARDIAERG